MTKLAVLKIAVRCGIWLWVFYWFAQIFIGDLGASPALELNHKLGNIVLVTLSINLLLGAALDLFKPPPRMLRSWVSERRFWGISSFLILVIHVFFYFVNEGFERNAWTQVYTKTYLIIASLAFLILLVLAVTSSDWSLRKLGGRRWKQLHRTVYVAQIFISAHILLIEKADFVLYVPWLTVLLLAQAARVVRRLPLELGRFRSRS